MYTYLHLYVRTTSTILNTINGSNLNIKYILLALKVLHLSNAALADASEL